MSLDFASQFIGDNWRCPKHGEHVPWITVSFSAPNDHLNGTYCQVCAMEQIAATCQKVTRVEEPEEIQGSTER